MQDKDSSVKNSISGKPIGGWLWVIMVMLIANVIQISVNMVTAVTELLSDDWKHYFQQTDELTRIRINIYMYLIISMIIGFGLSVWSFVLFIKRKKRFPAIFLGLLGYFLLTEIIRIYFLDYYAKLTNQDSNKLETGIFKTVFIIIIVGLYLNKGKRPNQTFIN